MEAAQGGLRRKLWARLIVQVCIIGTTRNNKGNIVSQGEPAYATEWVSPHPSEGGTIMHAQSAGNAAAANGSSVQLDCGPWILSDGERIQVVDSAGIAYVDMPLEVRKIIERALVFSDEVRVARLRWLQEVLPPLQRAWASKLAQALDSIEPGLSERLTKIAAMRIDEARACERVPLPSALNRPETLAMACAYLYWRDDPLRPPVSWSLLYRASSVKAVQLAQHLHSAVGVIACPACGKNAEARIIKRVTDKHQRPDGTLICGSCGHTESLSVSSPQEQANASMLSCACSVCSAKRDTLRKELRDSLAGLAAEISDRAITTATSLRTIAAEFNALPLNTKAVGNATDAIAYLPRHDRLVNIARYCRGDDWHSKRVSISLDDLQRFLEGCKGGADLRLEPLVDFSNTESLATRCLDAGSDGTLAQLRTVPDDRNAFREWISMACCRGVLAGFIPIPMAIEFTIRERPKVRLPQKPTDEHVSRDQPDISIRLADAIDLLKANGYYVIHHSKFK